MSANPGLCRIISHPFPELHLSVISLRIVFSFQSPSSYVQCVCTVLDSEVMDGFCTEHRLYIINSGTLQILVRFVFLLVCWCLFKYLDVAAH